MLLCSNGVPCRLRSRKPIRPAEALGSSSMAARDCSPWVETRADQTTSASPAAERTSSTVMSLR